MSQELGTLAVLGDLLWPSPAGHQGLRCDRAGTPSRFFGPYLLGNVRRSWLCRAGWNIRRKARARRDVNFCAPMSYRKHRPAVELSACGAFRVMAERGGWVRFP